MRIATTARPIALASMGEHEGKLLAWLADELRSAFGRAVVITERLDLPGNAFSRDRQQWRAGALLDRLAQHKRPEWLRLLGVVDVDLYAPELNFVFGEADQGRSVAVFSTVRLHRGAKDERRFHRRAAIEAVHEFGHTFGLRHCSRPGCVMWFSNTLEETDRKDVHPCSEHARALAHALETST